MTTYVTASDRPRTPIFWRVAWAAYLVEPLPLERNCELEEKRDDPGEVYVAHDLHGEGRNKKISRDTGHHFLPKICFQINYKTGHRTPQGMVTLRGLVVRQRDDCSASHTSGVSSGSPGTATLVTAQPWGGRAFLCHCSRFPRNPSLALSTDTSH